MGARPDLAGIGEAKSLSTGEEAVQKLFVSPPPPSPAPPFLDKDCFKGGDVFVKGLLLMKRPRTWLRRRGACPRG